MSHICIIEDDAAIAEIERDYLEINGFTVSIATDGVSGLNLTQKESFDLILLDLMLPQLDGFTLCRKLRERLDIPILMVTAKKEDIDKIRGLGLGADDYIVKPFNLDEVAARVTVQLRNQPTVAQESQASQKRSFKNLVLNPETFELESGEQTLRLGKKEFQIFETLLAHPKKIFTKEELYEAVWEEVYLPGDNTLNAQLSNLRKKIAQLDPDEDYIETVWGLGVRLKGDK